jgi:hypothetical protein
MIVERRPGRPLHEDVRSDQHLTPERTMTRENVGIALNAMADPDVCDQVAAGDLSVLGDLEFDEKERSVLVDAARDYPEVTGYSFSFATLNFSAPPPAMLSFADNGRFGQAAHYAFGVNAGPNLPGHEGM